MNYIEIKGSGLAFQRGGWKMAAIKPVGVGEAAMPVPGSWVRRSCPLMANGTLFVNTSSGAGLERDLSVVGPVLPEGVVTASRSQSHLAMIEAVEEEVDKGHSNKVNTLL